MNTVLANEEFYFILFICVSVGIGLGVCLSKLIDIYNIQNGECFCQRFEKNKGARK